MAELIFEQGALEDNTPCGVLRIAGDATVEQVTEIKQALLQALDAVDHLELNFDAVTDLDFFALQLLCSAHRTAVAWQKRLRFSGALADRLHRAIEVNGFSRHVGCALCSESERCLWIS